MSGTAAPPARLTGPNPQRLLMSKALGAAFLSHQVEQLESKMGKLGVERSQKGPVDTYLLDQGRRGERDADSASGGLRTGTRGRGAPRPTSERAQQQPRRTSGGADSHFEVIVLDSSVLIHALDQVTKWCKPHRSETLIVPLEVLNTLDLLKKGTSPLAVRARAASRALEAQVGVNPRIRVQGDDEFVLWDDISTKFGLTVLPGLSFDDAPEWMRQTLCCALWEQKNNPKSRAIGLALANPPASASDMADPSLSKFTPRAEGALLREWVARLGGGCGVKILEVAATSGGSAPRTSGDRPRHDADSERNTRGGFNPRKVSNGRGGGRGGDRDAGRLVEKVYNGPPLGGNGMGKIRLLARGEKLDP